MGYLLNFLRKKPSVSYYLILSFCVQEKPADSFSEMPEFSGNFSGCRRDFNSDLCGQPFYHYSYCREGLGIRDGGENLAICLEAM